MHKNKKKNKTKNENQLHPIFRPDSLTMLHFMLGSWKHVMGLTNGRDKIRNGKLIELF